MKQFLFCLEQRKNEYLLGGEKRIKRKCVTKPIRRTIIACLDLQPVEVLRKGHHQRVTRLNFNVTGVLTTFTDFIGSSDANLALDQSRIIQNVPW